MFRRLFILALAALLTVFSVSAADSRFLRCQSDVLAKVTVNAPAAADKDSEMKLEASGGSEWLKLAKIENKRDRVACHYRSGAISATYSYKIPPGWRCNGSSDLPVKGEDFTVTCYFVSR